MAFDQDVILTLGCSFGVNISFIYFQLRLLTVFNISIAWTLNCFISVVAFPFLLAGHHNRCHNHQGNYYQETFLNFLDFSDRFTSTKMPNQYAIVKICINETIYSCNFFWFFHIFLKHLIALQL